MHVTVQPRLMVFRVSRESEIFLRHLMSLIHYADKVRGSNANMVVLEGDVWSEFSDTRIAVRNQIEVDETGREAW